MKKVYIFVFMTLLVLSMGAAIASAQTLIAGKIYNADYTNVIDGASVQITCTHNSVQTIKNTTSLADGAYHVVFDEEKECNNGDLLSVFATKGDLSGFKQGEIHDDVFPDGWDLAVVNVPLVPEFGVFVGALTILGALGVFMYVRRK